MMKKMMALLLCLVMLPATVASAGTPEEDGLAVRLVTANIWGDYFGNPVKDREGAFLDAFIQYGADVIGMQECTANWHKSNLFSGLQEKGYTLVNDFKGVSMNYVPIFFRNDRFELLDSGFQYYMKVPNDRSKAYTFAVLKSLEDGQVFAVFNTHFWWKSGEEHDAIRMINAEQLVKGMKEIQAEYDCPVFAFGDLNCTKYAGPFQYFSENGIVRLLSVAQTFSKKSSHHGNPVEDENGKFHGSLPKNPEAKAIDHIIGLYEGFDCEVLTYQLILDQPVLDASDHSPVYADIVLNGKAE